MSVLKIYDGVFKTDERNLQKIQLASKNQYD
jgi:hypothetical protein